MRIATDCETPIRKGAVRASLCSQRRRSLSSSPDCRCTLYRSIWKQPRRVYGRLLERPGQARAWLHSHASTTHEGRTTLPSLLSRVRRCADEAMRIAAALKPMGPCNVQMRIADGRAVCFEVNVRFSGNDTYASLARLQ